MGEKPGNVFGESHPSRLVDSMKFPDAENPRHDAGDEKGPVGEHSVRHFQGVWILGRAGPEQRVEKITENENKDGDMRDHPRNIFGQAFLTGNPHGDELVKRQSRDGERQQNLPVKKPSHFSNSIYHIPLLTASPNFYTIRLYG